MKAEMSLGDLLSGAPAGTFVKAEAEREARDPAYAESKRRLHENPSFTRASARGRLWFWRMMDAIGGHLATDKERAALEREKARLKEAAEAPMPRGRA